MSRRYGQLDEAVGTSDAAATVSTPTRKDAATQHAFKPQLTWKEWLLSIPMLASVLGGVTDALGWFDNKIPHIKGRKFSHEIIANLTPGITVALVSLPLSISLAIAADATPVQGIITAAWAGLSSAVLGGSHYNVVGPTGALSGILSGFSVRYGPDVQPILAMLSGVFCFMVWVFHLERYFVFIPGAVMHGFTLGVAFIITMNQLNFALGLPKMHRHEKFLDNIYESLTHLDQTSWFAVVFFVISFLALSRLQKRFNKVPWAIVLAVFGIIWGILQQVASFPIQLATIQSRYGDLDLAIFRIPNLSSIMNEPFTMWIDIIMGCISISVVAVLETLISAFIADRMTKTLFNQRQEVLSIGITNFISGIAGGIPATAALARTSLNVRSGATSRAAGIVNGVSIIILSLVLFDLFKFLPLPVVATILVNVAARMVEWHEVKLLYKMDRAMFGVCVASAVVCVVEDPTVGIIAGAVLAMLRLMVQMRGAHAMLYIFQGTKCRLSFLFDTHDESKRDIRTARSKLTGEPSPDELDYELRLKEEEEERLGLATVEHSTVGGHRVRLPVAPSAAATLHAKAESLRQTPRAAPAIVAAETAVDVEAGVSGVVVAAETGAPSVATTPRASVSFAAADPTSESAIGKLSLPLEALGHTTFASKSPRKSARHDTPAHFHVHNMAELADDALLPTVAVYTVPAYFTYVSGAAHRDRLRCLFKYGEPHHLPGIGVVALSLQECYYADPDAIEAAGDLYHELQREGIAVYMLGFHERVRTVLEHAHWFHSVEVFPDYAALLAHLRVLQAEGRLPVRPPPPPPPEPVAVSVAGVPVVSVATDTEIEADEAAAAAAQGVLVAPAGSVGLQPGAPVGSELLFRGSGNGGGDAAAASDSAVFSRRGRGSGSAATAAAAAASGGVGWSLQQRAGDQLGTEHPGSALLPVHAAGTAGPFDDDDVAPTPNNTPSVLPLLGAHAAEAGSHTGTTAGPASASGSDAAPRRDIMWD